MPSPPAALLQKLLVQSVFLLTGVLSTCVAQFVFYQGAGDQKAMLLPLCNYLGMMLVGLLPASTPSSASASAAVGKQTDDSTPVRVAEAPEDAGEPECTPSPNAQWLKPEEAMELTRRPGAVDTEAQAAAEQLETGEASDKKSAAAPATVACALTTVQLCVVVSVALDFAGCVFSNLGLSMAGSGLYQVVYSSVICWSALMSRFILKKVVTRDEWLGIALVTFGLAFSALGASGSGRNGTLVLMGCFNTLVGAAFYGGNYVTGEFTLQLAERPQPTELCLKIGAACVAIIAVYQSVFVLPEWDALVSQPIAEAHGDSTRILLALVVYTLSQLAHGYTYFLLLGSSGAVTTGIMQSLRAVCVFVLSSLLYCGQQESQCFDTKRGVATLLVVSGVLFYSWAKSQKGKAGSVLGPQVAALRRPVAGDAKHKMVAGKNYVV
ncbi:hypothetical protein BBJ28_00010814 [Nothophytophthora sp. Chile5]|nr:hypothetical protein BBJ28_00010814 [Nothophytophthora sp. Chile5]